MTSELLAQAQEAGHGWGGWSDRPTLVAHRENAVFRTSLTDARPVALRLHRPGYQSDASITEELLVCETLADCGFACPWPFRTDHGSFVYPLASGGRASVVQWLEGRPLSALPPADRYAPVRMHALGALLADLHLTADMVLAPLLARPKWDADGLIGPDALWGDAATDPEMTDAERALIRAGQALARTRLAAIPKTQMGMIHGDCLPENVLERNGAFSLIDFDDSGSGYRLYDLGTALVTAYGLPELHPAAAALEQGYLAAGGPLPDAAFADLWLFVMLRAQASAAWSRDRLPADDPRRAAYRARAVGLTETVLKAAEA